MVEVGEPVVVAVMDEPLQAQMLQTRLAAAGVCSYLDGEHTIGANPLLA